jgi:hypothetical protein
MSLPTSYLPFETQGVSRPASRVLRAFAIALCVSASPAAANVAVTISPGEQSEPVMVSDGAAGAIVAWQDFRGGAESDIYAQRIGPDGTPQWTPGGVAVCTASAFQTRPRIVSDGAGGAIVAWTDYRNSNGDIYVQRLTASGSAMWTPGGVPICDDGQPQLGVELTPDGSGGAIAVWEDFRSGLEGDLFAQRIAATGIPAWGLNGVAVCDTVSSQTSPSICSDGSSGAIVIWRDQRASGAGDLYAQSLSGAGARRWGTQGIPVCAANGGQYDPLVVTDGAGGAIATWMDERNAGIADIYAQRIGPGGLSEWTADGVRMCDAPSYQLFPVMTSDGLGGALIAWEDSRSDTTVDIYAQRVGPDGAVLWGSGGIRLCDATGYESLPSIAADGGGGAILIWQDQRSLGDDVYAQRVSATGLRMWPATGVAISIAPDSQLGPVLVSDGAGGALFAWYDGRNGNWDIYAQHADAWGGLGTTVGVGRSGSGAGVRLSPPVPNPSSGPVRITFRIPSAAAVDLALFDAAGRRVRTLEGGMLPPGVHTRSLDLAGDGRRALPPGLYFVRLSTLGVSAVTRLVTLP